MNNYDWLQVIVYFAVLLALVKPLGGFMARVYQGEKTFLTPILGPVERFVYRIAGINAEEDMGWKQYAKVMLVFNLLGFLAVYGLQRFQGLLPFNPAGHARRVAGLGVQHRHKLCHQHKLAGICGREHDELPYADAWANGAELPVCGDGHGGTCGTDKRICTSYHERYRQLLGRPRAYHALYTYPAVPCFFNRAGLAGSGADLQQDEDGYAGPGHEGRQRERLSARRILPWVPWRPRSP